MLKMILRMQIVEISYIIKAVNFDWILICVEVTHIMWISCWLPSTLLWLLENDQCFVCTPIGIKYCWNSIVKRGFPICFAEYACWSLCYDRIYASVIVPFILLFCINLFLLIFIDEILLLEQLILWQGSHFGCRRFIHTNFELRTIVKDVISRKRRLPEWAR